MITSESKTDTISDIDLIELIKKSKITDDLLKQYIPYPKSIKDWDDTPLRNLIDGLESLDTTLKDNISQSNPKFFSDLFNYWYEKIFKIIDDLTPTPLLGNSCMEKESSAKFLFRK